jgi:hypothetical protein
MKIRSRKFEGRCARHKRYNPAVDGQGGIKAGCARCGLLFEIWQTSLKLNQLIRRVRPHVRRSAEAASAEGAGARPAAAQPDRGLKRGGDQAIYFAELCFPND